MRELTSFQVLTRFVLTGVMVWFWHAGQQLVRSYTAPLRIVSDIALADLGHALFGPVRAYVVATGLAPALHTAQLAVTDAVVVTLIVFAIFGPTVRGSLALLLAALCRSVAQTLTPFVAVPATILLPPRTFPTLFGNVATHETSFFAPHVAVAVIALLAASASRSAWRARLMAVATVAAAFQVTAALTLHTSWSIDVFVALTIAVAAFRASRLVAPTLDGMKTLS